MDKSPKYNIAIADDHLLVRKGLLCLINSFNDFVVVFEADDGIGVVEKIRNCTLPDLIILDINMPKVDGYETAQWLRENYPQIRILALTMHADKYSIIHMLRCGINGYISKMAEPYELKNALLAVIKNGFYLPDNISGAIINEISRIGTEPKSASIIGDRELQFLDLLARGMSYKEIASKMYLSPRTLDDYKKSISKKTGIKSRIELVSYAIKNGLVNIMK
jgi:DNA-binding NarL/FixJ family response regulator